MNENVATDRVAKYSNKNETTIPLDFGDLNGKVWKLKPSVLTTLLAIEYLISLRTF